ncbi:MAG: hypothetical protein ACP5KN_09835 [Armatimonadota bacterium]
MTSLRTAAGALVLLLAVLPASAQTQLAVEITEVEIEQFSNGVEITLKADGLLQVLAIGAWYRTDEEHSFELILPNARSSTGTFVDVSQYPVNYLKLEIPPQERVEELVIEAGELGAGGPGGHRPHPDRAALSLGARAQRGAGQR